VWSEAFARILEEGSNTNQTSVQKKLLKSRLADKGKSEQM